MQSHPHRWPDGWIFNIFRIASPEFPQIRRLLSEGLRKWMKLFTKFNFPPGVFLLDRSDYRNTAELVEIGRRLIRKERTEDAYCMQWVLTVLSLALCMPLNRPTLEKYGLLRDFEKNWPEIATISEDLEPLPVLPIVPYTPVDILAAMVSLYSSSGIENVRDQLSRDLGRPLSEISINGTANSVGQFLHSELQNGLNIPDLSSPPILPALEYRKKDHRGTVCWEYVATTLPDEYCTEQ